MKLNILPGPPGNRARRKYLEADRLTAILSPHSLGRTKSSGGFQYKNADGVKLTQGACGLDGVVEGAGDCASKMMRYNAANGGHRRSETAESIGLVSMTGRDCCDLPEA